jgi:hypothetical protein
VVPPSKDIVEVSKGSSSRYRHPEAASLRGEKKEEAASGSMAPSSLRRPLPVAPPSKDIVEVPKGYSSRYCHPEAASLREEKEKEAASAARTVAGNDEPQAISELETPKQNHAALPPSNPPSKRSAEPALLTETTLQPGVSQHNRNLAPRNATSTARAVANLTVEVPGGFDMLDHESERHSEQADYLRILQDKFDTPRSNSGHRYSSPFIDDTSINNGGYGNFPENLIDPDNESYDGRHSLKSVRSPQSMLATQASD